MKVKNIYTNKTVFVLYFDDSKESIEKYIPKSFKIDNIEKETNKELLEKEVMEIYDDGYELEVWVK